MPVYCVMYCVSFERTFLTYFSQKSWNYFLGLFLIFFQDFKLKILNKRNRPTVFPDHAESKSVYRFSLFQLDRKLFEVSWQILNRYLTAIYVAVPSKSHLKLFQNTREKHNQPYLIIKPGGKIKKVNYLLKIIGKFLNF
jgi:hypothetical protein